MKSVTSEHDPDLALYLDNLSIGLKCHYDPEGNSTNCRKSNAIDEKAVKLTPQSHPDCSGRVSGRSIRGSGPCYSFRTARVSVQDVVQLLVRDESFRAFTLGFLNSVKYKLEIDCRRLEQNVGRLIRQCLKELSRASSTSQEKDFARSVGKNCYATSKGFLWLMKPPPGLRPIMADNLKEPVQPFLLECFIEDSATQRDSSKNKLAEQDQDEHLNTSDDEVEASFEPEFDPPFSTETRERFLTYGGPIVNLRGRLEDLVLHEEPEQFPPAATKKRSQAIAVSSRSSAV